VLHLPPRLLLPRLDVSSSPFAAFALFSDYREGAAWAGGGGAPGDGGADMSMRSPFLCYAGRVGILLCCFVTVSSLRSDSHW
jgi:hypothetical protein